MARYNSDGSPDTSFGGQPALSGTVSFTEDGSPAVLNADATVDDAALGASGNYSGTTLTLMRHGGANAADLIGDGFITGHPFFTHDGRAVGSVASNDAGKLQLTFGFNSNVTLEAVNDVLDYITYRNISDNPAASVQMTGCSPTAITA
jgi:hypothetical protein